MRRAARRVLLQAILALLAWGGTAHAADGLARTAVTLGTATAGGGFEAYGRVLAEVVNALDPTIEVRPQATGGSTENVALLAAGRVDLALVTGEVAHEAFAAGGAQSPSVLSAMYSTPGLFAVRADSPYRRIEDLKGRRVIFGARGSGLVVLARYTLEGLGLDMQRDFRAILLERIEDAPAMLLDGRAEALWGGGAGWPPFVALARTGARFVVPDEEAIERIVARHGLLSRLTLPPSSYPGQDAPLASVGTWSLILIRPGLDEELAYRLARALHRGEAELARRLPRAAETNSVNTLATVPLDRLHPGALRYLREAGLIQAK